MGPILPAARTRWRVVDFSLLAERAVVRLNAFMRPNPRSLAVVLFSLIGSLAPGHEPVADMIDAAQRFLGALDAPQKARAVFPLTATEREAWFFVPIARRGVPLAEMSGAQRDRALALVQSGLSQRGWASAEAIRSLETILKEMEGHPTTSRRNPELYYVTIFGEPVAGASWGWRFEGHHLSFNFTIVEGKHVRFAPGFFGSNPAEVRAGPRQGERNLGAEDDLGRALVKSLDEAQRKIAVFATRAPNDIFTSNQARVDPLSPAGLPVAQMTPTQREALRTLLTHYANRNRAELADAALAEINAAGFDQVCFAWAGGFEPGQGHYYRIQGPTFVVEFDNTQNDANHIHSVWRDFKNDFGQDALAQHYANDHPK
jgi:Protein of unknown function (DUF3500)